MSTLIRSALYIPGSKARALEKAATLPCDAILFDLEDAVAPDEKPAARALLAQMLGEVDYGTRLRLVRVNAAATEWGAADLAAFADHPGVDGLLLPKVNGPEDLDLPGDKPLWAMMETPMGVLNAAAIAAHPRLQGLVMGTNDLLKDLGARYRPDRAGLAVALGQCLLAARAQGRLILDGVYNAFKDLDGLAIECEQGRDMGFDGKTLIHPDQLATANRVFAPSEAEIDLARRQIAAHEAAAARGEGVAVLDGRIVENLHVATARVTLEKALAIAGRA